MDTYEARRLAQEALSNPSVDDRINLLAEAVLELSEAIDSSKPKKEKSDIDHLHWAINQRSEIQLTILALYELLRHRPPSWQDDTRHVVNNLVGAAFSLWRAVFLADTFRDVYTIHQSQEAFLEKVLTDNAINFSDDKANRHWTVGYYLENAKFRLGQAVFYSDHHFNTKLTETAMPHLRLIGTMGVELTRFEWESVHYALRLILDTVQPDGKIKPMPPASPKPKKGPLDDLFADDVADLDQS